MNNLPQWNHPSCAQIATKRKVKISSILYLSIQSPSSERNAPLRRRSSTLRSITFHQSLKNPFSRLNVWWTSFRIKTKRSSSHKWSIPPSKTSTLVTMRSFAHQLKCLIRNLIISIHCQSRVNSRSSTT